MERWTPEYFEAAHLSYLPIQISLEKDDIIVDYMKKGELKEAFAVVQSAADHGYNTGIDEIDWDFFEEFVSNASWIFVARFKWDPNIVGLVLVHPSFYHRSLAPCVAFVQIFLTPKLFLNNGNAYKELVRQATRFAEDLDLGYYAVLTPVFSTCADMILDLRSLGFELTACLPRCGNLVSKKKVDTYMLFKEFKRGLLPEEIMRRPFEELARFAEEVSSDLPTYLEDSTPLKVIPSLPVKYTFQRAGIKTIWRNVRKEDAPIVYDMLCGASRNGSGYSMEEHPTFHFYYQYYFREQYGMMVEEELTGKLICFNGFEGYWPYRTMNPDVLEGSVIVHPDYRGKGISQEVGALSDHIYAELGFKGMLSDTAIVNTAMLESQTKIGFIKVGFSPRSIFLEGKGMFDGVYSYKSLEGIVPFSEKIKQLPTSMISKL